MTRVSKPAPTDLTAHAAAVKALTTVGLEEHQTVRFHHLDESRWIQGTVVGLEPDGSLGLVDARGRRRSIRITEVEVESHGPRGGRIWVPLTEIASADEQLGLF